MLSHSAVGRTQIGQVLGDRAIPQAECQQVAFAILTLFVLKKSSKNTFESNSAVTDNIFVSVLLFRKQISVYKFRSNVIDACFKQYHFYQYPAYMPANQKLPYKVLCSSNYREEFSRRLPYFFPHFACVDLCFPCNSAWYGKAIFVTIV